MLEDLHSFLDEVILSKPWSVRVHIGFHHFSISSVDFFNQNGKSFRFLSLKLHDPFFLLIFSPYIYITFPTRFMFLISHPLIQQTKVLNSFQTIWKIWKLFKPSWKSHIPIICPNMKVILLATTFLLIISRALANISNEQDFNMKQARELNGTNLIYHNFFMKLNKIFVSKWVY